MSTINGIDQITVRTLDGLSSLDVDYLTINGSNVNVANFFDKTTDTSDDITEGVSNLFVTPAEKALFHDPVTLGTANGLSLSNQVLSLGLADGSSNGALGSNDWTIFNNKQDLITGAATTITSSNLTINQALVSDGSGKVAVSGVTSTELGYLTGATSNIQGQINALSGASLWTLNSTPNPDVVHLSNTSNSVAIGSTTVPTSAIRLFVNGTAQANDVYATGSVSADSNVYVGSLGTITADAVQIAGGLHMDSGNLTMNTGEIRGGTAGGYVRGRFGVGMNSVPGSYQFDVTGAGRFTGQLDAQNGLYVTKNAANSAFYGVDHCYLEMYPRGAGAGRQAYLGFGGSNVRDLSLINQDTGRLDLGTNSTARMTILNGGFVGIDTINPDTKLEVQGNINSGVGAKIRNINAGADAHSLMLIYNNNNAGLAMFLNSPARTVDGGVNTATIRNDVGSLRLQAQGSVGMTIAASTGRVTQANGQDSLTTYGPTPFASWNASLIVGAGSGDHTAAKTAAVCVTNGNLHIDVARDAAYEMYLNYYAAVSSSDNKNLRDYSKEHYLGSVGAGGTNRSFRAATPIQSIIKHYLPVSGGLYNAFVNAWVRMLPGIFEVNVVPLRQTDYYKIRVKLSVVILQGSSVAFRVMRLIGGAASGVFSVGTAGVNQGHSRTAPNGANEPGYWTNPPVYIEVWDYPNTQQTLTYYVEYMTYSPAYGFQLNYVTIGGQGGDATGVISTICVEQYEYSVINN